MVNTYLPALMQRLLYDFAANYSADNPSLTGNTYTGTTVGAYYNGSLIGSMNVIDLGATPPTHGQTFPGDTGFADYETGEVISPFVNGSLTENDDWVENNGVIKRDKEDGPPSVKEYSNNKKRGGRRRKLSFQSVRSGAYAWQIAKSFLQSYKPNVKGYSLVMVVGSEYSAWLEKVRGLNILTSTKDSVQYYVMNLGAKL
jgi:hypothetical protein